MKLLRGGLVFLDCLLIMGALGYYCYLTGWAGVSLLLALCLLICLAAVSYMVAN